MPVRDRGADRADVKREFGMTPDQPILLAIGRQTAAKNYPMLYRAARRVLETRDDVRFLCAGHGEEQPNLKAMHEELGLGDRLRMLGLRCDVPRLLAAADVFCLPSRWEGMPNSLIEAMAAGLPAITARVPGIEEVVEDGRTRAPRGH